VSGLTGAHGIHVYPGAGTVDGTNGDHIMIMPAYNINEEDIDTIVDRIARLVELYFDELDASKE
jgi:adenosylmethionine-8-amino-7-oxononanoate aminotransferase